MQLQTMTTWWQALPSVDRVRGHRDRRGIAEHPQRVGSRQEDHDWVRAPSGWQNVARPAESRAKGQSRVHLPGMSLPMEPETALPPPPHLHPGPLRATPLRPGIYLCHWTVPVTLKPRFTFSRTFISGSFMTLGECAKFLIRLARQPEAAAAPRSLHGLSALQHNKPLYSFEDNADYVYDVMWSPVHPALFACVDGMGRLDLWNLNNDTEVSGGAGAGPGGGEGGAVSLSPSPPSPNSLHKKSAFFGQTLLLQLGCRPPVLDSPEGNWQMHCQKSFNLTSSLNRGRCCTIDDPFFFFAKSKTILAHALPLRGRNTQASFRAGLK